MTFVSDLGDIYHYDGCILGAKLGKAQSKERDPKEKSQGAEEAPRNWKATLPKADVATEKPDFGY